MSNALTGRLKPEIKSSRRWQVCVTQVQNPREKKYFMRLVTYEQKPFCQGTSNACRIYFRLTNLTLVLEFKWTIFRLYWTETFNVTEIRLRRCAGQILNFECCILWWAEKNALIISKEHNSFALSWIKCFFTIQNVMLADISLAYPATHPKWPRILIGFKWANRVELLIRCKISCGRP